MTIAPSPPKIKRVPPLQNGDRLTRPEFERRFAATPNLIKAELIEGVVYMALPMVSFEEHGAPHFDVIGWMAMYRMMTPGVLGVDDKEKPLTMANSPSTTS